MSHTGKRLCHRFVSILELFLWDRSGITSLGEVVGGFLRGPRTAPDKSFNLELLVISSEN